MTGSTGARGRPALVDDGPSPTPPRGRPALARVIRREPRGVRSAGSIPWRGSSSTGPPSRPSRSTPAGTLVASAGRDAAWRDSGLRRGSRGGTSPSGPKNVNSVAFSPTAAWSRPAAGTGPCGLVRRDGRAIWPGPRLEHPDEVNSVAFSPDGPRIATACADNRCPRLGRRTGGSPSAPPRPRRIVNAVAFSPDGERVSPAARRGRPGLGASPTGSPRRPCRHEGVVYAAPSAPTAGRLLTGRDSRPASGTSPPGSPPSPGRPANSGPGSARWRSAPGERGSARRGGGDDRHGSGTCPMAGRSRLPWITRIGCTPSPSAPTDRVSSPVADSRRNSGMRPVVNRSHLRWSTWISSSPQRSARMVCGSSPQAVPRIWDAASGRALTPPLEHRGGATWAAFSPDGQQVITTSGDGVRIWDLAGAADRPSVTLEHGGMITSVAFSPDGTKVATASLDMTARIWDAKTGRPICPPLCIARMSIRRCSPPAARVS